MCSYARAKAKTALKDLDLPFFSVEDFVQQQLRTLIEHHKQWKQQLAEMKSTK